METKRRLDVYLVENGLASGREKAKERIQDGEVTVNGKTVTKASFPVDDTDCVECDVQALAYVGRGGLKLEKALQVSGIVPAGWTALDIGASTGGFTHCLLQHGARRVYAVDVGHDQLHASLRCDPRVVNLEGTDVRSSSLEAVIPKAEIDIMTMDVSFISVRQVLPFVLPFLKKGARMVVLIKPQFEAGRADVGKNGIVRNKTVHIRVLRELLSFFEEQQMHLSCLTASPITGGAGKGRGNIEYLAILSCGDNVASNVVDVRNLVDETFDHFSSENSGR